MNRTAQTVSPATGPPEALTVPWAERQAATPAEAPGNRTGTQSPRGEDPNYIGVVGMVRLWSEWYERLDWTADDRASPGWRIAI
jgi:hypothetical protein